MKNKNKEGLGARWGGPPQKQKKKQQIRGLGQVR